jgi:hypothetical protein
MANYDDKCTTHHEFYAALRDVIIASDPAKREDLHNTIHGWSDHDPETFFWAIGPQSPTMLSQIILGIDDACESDASKSRKARLVDRKSQGSA